MHSTHNATLACDVRAVTRFASLALALSLAACSGTPPADDAAPADNAMPAAEQTDVALNQLSDQERQDGWRLLFDGNSLGGWRGYNRPDLPAGWEAVDGALTRTGPGGDIITVEQYDDFELALDWMVRARGNSGIFFNAVEGYDRIYEVAPEVQILDDAGHADGGSPLTSAGANYGLHPAPRGVVKPAGEWNSVRLVVNGNHVEHWLNGTKVVEYELGSEDWKQRVANSKFAQWPAYGTAASGHIGLQDHGDWVAFRNIRIRELP